MPGNHPNAYESYVFLERRAGESTDDLLSGVLHAAAEASGLKDGLGVHEGGAEIHLPDGSVLEAVGFGPMTSELRIGAEAFAVRTDRAMAFWSSDGVLRTLEGTTIREDGCTFKEW
jgi:hypothetical protein